MEICFTGKRRCELKLLLGSLYLLCMYLLLVLSESIVDIIKWLKQGEDASVEAAVMAISNCLREPVGPTNCSEVK